MKFLVLFSFLFLTCNASSENLELRDEFSSDFWLKDAKNFVNEKLKVKNIKTKAKNVILFLGDGLGFTTIAAARVEMGGEEKKFAFENFPHTATTKVYCLDESVPDSACTTNSFLRGFKGNYGTIGLSGMARRYNCDDSANHRLQTKSIASWAQEAGMATGFVTNTRVTHATTAGLYSSVAERDWENDAIVTANKCNHKVVNDSAEFLVRGEVGSNFKVVFGGGAMNFISNIETEHGERGARNDGANLINEWLSSDNSRKFIRTKSEMNEIDSDVDQVMGLFTSDRFPYHLDNINPEIPTLTEMTLKAIEILSQEDDGYFLLVEGDRMDGAHHDNMAKYAIDEAIEFNKAIEAALGRVDLNETLVIVTSDHSHSLAFAGGVSRKSDIFGYSGQAADGMPYFTLSYANGPYHNLHYSNGLRVDPKSFDISPLNFNFPATVPLKVESHSGEDTGVWAIGPHSHLFRGNLEQTLVAHIMAYAACIGEGLRACD